MTNLTQKSSRQFLGASVRVVTLALFLAVFGASAVLAQTRGYVTNLGSNDVSVIDTGTNTVVAAIPVGSGPFSVAVTPNGAFAYVANAGSNRCSATFRCPNSARTSVSASATDSYSAARKRLIKSEMTACCSANTAPT